MQAQTSRNKVPALRCESGLPDWSSNANGDSEKRLGPVLSLPFQKTMLSNWQGCSVMFYYALAALLVISMSMYGSAPAVPDFLHLSAVTLANNQVAGKKKIKLFYSVYLYPNVNISVSDPCRSLRCSRTVKSTEQVCLISARKHLLFILDWKHTGGNLARA